MREVFEKRGALSEDDKKFLFIYAKMDKAIIEEMTGETRERYGSNILLVLNCMLSYGFIPDKAGSPCNLKTHYWQLFESLFCDQPSITFIQSLNSAFADLDSV